MALFARRKNSGRVAADARDDDPQLARRPTTIGDLLRETREQYGTTVEQVGATLRIRPVFLQAIEGNHYDRLPGPVYALGFVRTYADYLGLDGEAIAQRFKTEAAGLETKSDLSFPMPLPERSLPGGALLLVALIVAACAYAIWYYRAAGERSRTERVAEVPSQLIALPPPASAPEADVGGPDATAAGGSTPSPPASAPGEQAAIPPVPAAPSAGSTGAPAAAEPTGAPAAAPTVAAVAPPAPPTPAPAIEPARLPAIPEPPAAAPALDTPRVYGVTNGPVRIIIKANADSWVQVRDADQAVVSMRVLKQGETYRVPDRPGMVLRTGNAGGLEIAVDGKTVAPVGPPGKTRNVALDPQRLLAGSATLE
jgi:cytoskeleton protein RodZ